MQGARRSDGGVTRCGVHRGVHREVHREYGAVQGAPECAQDEGGSRVSWRCKEVQGAPRGDGAVTRCGVHRGVHREVHREYGAVQGAPECAQDEGGSRVSWRCKEVQGAPRGDGAVTRCGVHRGVHREVHREYGAVQGAPECAQDEGGSRVSWRCKEVQGAPRGDGAVTRCGVHRGVHREVHREYGAVQGAPECAQDEGGSRVSWRCKEVQGAPRGDGAVTRCGVHRGVHREVHREYGAVQGAPECAQDEGGSRVSWRCKEVQGAPRGDGAVTRCGVHRGVHREVHREYGAVQGAPECAQDEGGSRVSWRCKEVQGAPRGDGAVTRCGVHRGVHREVHREYGAVQGAPEWLKF